MPENKIGGVIAAVPTPFSASHEIDVEAFVEHGEWCLDHGCNALNVLGTTGEANSLSVGQRGQLMHAAALRLDRTRLMVGTGASDVATAISLTKLAAELRYAAALVLPPFYYKPVSDDGLFAWFKELVSQTESEPIAIYLYNFPQLTGIEFSAAIAARLQAAFPHRVKGAKDSSGNLDYARSLAQIPGFWVFPSSEASLAEARRSGFAGCISSTVNINPGASAALWRNQDDAGLLDEVRSLRQNIIALPTITAVKYLVRKRSRNSVWRNIAPPNMALVGAQSQAELDSCHSSLEILAR